MLKKKNRLSKLENKKGDFFKTEFYNLKISNSDSKETRFAFVISKKISKSAVLRNRTKRILAEIIRKNLEKFLPSKNIIITVKKILDLKQKEQVEKTILESFKQAKIIK